jgi:nucleoside-diphosphate-sugar epimerase
VVAATGGTFGVLGARGLVGTPLLRRLREAGQPTLAYSRRPAPVGDDGLWRQLGAGPPEPVDCWISLMPIWVLHDYFPLIAASGATRLVQVSSTSRFTKTQSGSAHERDLVRQLVEGEARLAAWAGQQGIGWTVLRPTLIYAMGHDRNVTEIARFIRRFGFFPLLGRSTGLRQPVAADDVAHACLLAAASVAARDAAFNIAGGDVLPYRDMVARIFGALGRQPIMPSIPIFAFRAAIAALRLVPRYRHWTPAMAERMNLDMAFDNAPAAAAFGYAPRGFEPGPWPA